MLSLCIEDGVKPINLTIQNGTQVVGFYDSESGIAVAYCDRLEVFFTTNTVSYDEFVEFIKSTTINFFLFA